jgi:rod shape-determining protein MreC
MSKKSQYVILVLVVLLVGALLSLPAPTVARLKLAVSGLFFPLFGWAASTHEAVTKGGDSLVSKKELLREIKDLRESNQVLNLQIQQSAAVWRENDRLRQMLNKPPQKPWRLRLARVVARDPAVWWRSVWIDLGSRDGVRANCAVLAPEGLVGKVQTVAETRSQVLLLGDPGLRVAVAVLGGAGTNVETGILMSTSSSPRENNMVDLEYLSGSGANRAHPGDRVVTSGVGGVFSNGIPVGQVVDLTPRDNGLGAEGRVRLSANLGALEEVWVILP